MSVDLSPTLDLHRRILSELELREAATREQETEARRALDSALQSIAAERRAIKQCRDLLTQAATLYKSFVGSDRATTKTDVPQPIEAPVAAADPELAPAQSSAGDEPAPLVTDAPSPYAEAPQPTEAPVAAPAPAPAVAEPLPWATEAPVPHVNVPQPTEISAAVREQASEPEVTGEGLSTLAADELVPDTTPLPGTSIEAESFARVENLRSEITAESGRGGGGSWWAGMWRRGTRDEEVELSWKEAYPPVEGAERAIWDHNHPNRTQE